MQLKDLFLAIPRSTIETLCKYRILPQNVIVWYDLICFFDTLPQTMQQMQKYLEAADKYHLSDEQTRKVVSRLNRYV